MNIETTTPSPLEMSLKVTVSKDDYNEEYKKQIREYRSQASLKGFRKGKAPESIIRKMFGKQILSEVVLKSLQNGLYDYLKEADIQYLGNPIVSQDQEPLDFEQNQEDYSLSFDLGIAPDFDIDTIEIEIKADRSTADLSDDDLKEGLQHLQKRYGRREEMKDDILVDDMLDIKAFELDGKNIKEGGWATDFLILVSQIKDEDVKKKLLTLKVDGEFDFNAFTLESNDKAWVDKHILRKEPEDETEVGEMFRGTIKRVERLIPAEIDQEFFDQAFGKDQVKEESEALDKVKDDLMRHCDQMSESILIYNLRTSILDHYEMDLPKDFLKRWLMEQRETTELTDDAFDNFVKGMRWTLIRNKLAEKYEISVDEGDVFESIKEGIRSYFAQYYQFHEDDRLNEMADNMMQDQNTYNREYDKLLNLKIIEQLKEKLTITDKSVSKKELEEEYQEITAAMNA